MQPALPGVLAHSAAFHGFVCPVALLLDGPRVNLLRREACERLREVAAVAVALVTPRVAGLGAFEAVRCATEGFNQGCGRRLHAQASGALGVLTSGDGRMARQALAPQ